MAKITVTPTICAYPDESSENMNIEVELPGVNKEDINFNLYEHGFYIVAKSEGIKYMGSYSFCMPVVPDGAIAKYSNGLLKVNVPYKKELFKKGVKVDIE